jgi:hypothetical protein
MWGFRWSLGSQYGAQEDTGGCLGYGTMGTAEAPVITEPIGHGRSYLACRIGQLVPISSQYLGSWI